jgi:hypothetical protein
MTTPIPEDFIYGMIVDYYESSNTVVNSMCYSGLQNTRCTAQYTDDDNYYQNNLYYYNHFDDTYGQTYCLQCCGNGAYRHQDIWDLQCSADAILGPVTNLYAKEIRFAKNSYIGDKEYVSCPIKRSACVYDGTQLLYCNNVASDTTYLVGITVTIDVQLMYSQFNSWKSVTGCSVESIESDVALATGDIFYEKYIMNFSPGPSSVEPFPAVLLSILSVFGIYMILYYCRREHCLVCGKKLVFCFDMCYLCRFYGADMPDPLLVKALREKAVQLQGTYPERFPGSRRIVKFIRAIYHTHIEHRLFGTRTIIVYPEDTNIESDGVVERIEIVKAPTSTTPSSKMNDEEVYVNPYLIKNDPYFLYAAIRHPNNPAQAPDWVINRELPEEGDMELNDYRENSMMHNKTITTGSNID